MDKLEEIEKRVKRLEEQATKQDECLKDLHRLVTGIAKDMQPIRDWSATGRSLKRMAAIAGVLTTIGGFITGVAWAIKYLFLKH
jgi:hypothetical protein